MLQAARHLAPNVFYVRPALAHGLLYPKVLSIWGNRGRREGLSCQSQWLQRGQTSPGHRRGKARCPGQGAKGHRQRVLHATGIRQCVEGGLAPSEPPVPLLMETHLVPLPRLCNLPGQTTPSQRVPPDFPAAEDPPSAHSIPCRDPHSYLHHQTPLFHIQAPGPGEPQGSWRDGGGWVGSSCILPA